MIKSECERYMKSYFFLCEPNRNIIRKINTRMKREVKRSLKN